MMYSAPLVAREVRDRTAAAQRANAAGSRRIAQTVHRGSPAARATAQRRFADH